jgi:hypothetical protein
MSARKDKGQALVEFAFAGAIFVMLIMGIIDLGLAIYKYNGVSQAAREIARATSIHPGSPLGSSAETAAAVATQRAMIPGLTLPTFACVDHAGATVPGNGSGGCASGDVVIVTVHAPYEPSTPLLGLMGTFDIRSAASNEIQ